MSVLTSLVAAWRAAAPRPLRDAIARTRVRLNPAAGATYYSGHGEDALIVGWFRHFGVDPAKARYLDIGAAHPIRLSNTYMLYRLGARGVLVEPDPDQAQALRRARPNDVVIDAGMAFDERRRASLFRLTSPVYNTFSRERAERIVAVSRSWTPDQRQEIRDAVEVPLIPVNEVIAGNFATGEAPNVVSIDVEGVDLPILRSLDTDLLSRDPEVPCFICIEAGDPLEEVNPILDPMGFELTARTPDNWLFLRHSQKTV
jgi:FkbM family methyltransferase